MCAILILVLLTTAPGLFGSIPGRDLRWYEDPSQTRALEYLDQAHTLSRNFSVEERGWTVLDAAEVAAPIAPDRGNKWSLEVWEVAKQLPRGQSRIALQKNALRELALHDPNGALRLCRQQDLPSSWDAVHNVTEDSRSLGYGNIFFKPVWENGGAPYRAKLENVARFFGQTGQYPYAAMSHIAVDIAPSDPPKVSRILHDATRYFQRDPGFISTNQEFVRFILATRKIASPEILRKELMVATTA